LPAWISGIKVLSSSGQGGQLYIQGDLMDDVGIRDWTVEITVRKLTPGHFTDNQFIQI
jgi:hypothetical protein